MKIQIRKSDIERGQYRNKVFNPVVYALLRATGHLWACDFDCVYPAAHPSLAVRLPPELYQWLEDYDHDRAVGPAEFEIDLPYLLEAEKVKIDWDEFESRLAKY